MKMEKFNYPNFNWNTDLKAQVHKVSMNINASQPLLRTITCKFFQSMAKSKRWKKQAILSQIYFSISFLFVTCLKDK